MSVADTRRLVKTRPTFQARRLGIGIAWLLVAGVGLTTLNLPLRIAPGFLLLAARWGSTLLVTYGAISAGYALAETIYAALGFETPLLHDAPLRARSVRELWGERWARPVGTWLGETFFRPYARRRRPVVGALAAFGGSAAFHAYVAWVALGVVDGFLMAACVFGFFMAQAVVMALEGALGVKKWAPWAGHTWTVLWMLGTAPLFIEPTARVLAGLTPL